MPALRLHASPVLAGPGWLLLMMLALGAPTAALGQRAHAIRRAVVADPEVARPEARTSDPAAGPTLLPEPASRRIVELEAEIEATVAADGANAERLIEPLTALALLHHERGAYRSAAAAIADALGIIRVHHGLHALEQVPLLRLSMRNEKALGDAAAAWEVEQELLALAEHHPMALQTARVLREVADARMDTYERYTDGEFPPEIVLGCFYAPPEGSREAAAATARGEHRNCTAGSRGFVRRRLMREAQFYYAQSVNILLENEVYSDALPGLFMDLVRSSYRYANPALGERSLRYLLAYRTTHAEPWLARIDTLLQIADWQLIYADSKASNETALATYAQAWALLREQEIPPEAIAARFSPAMPVVLPVFVPTALATRTMPSADGYVDVGFEITRDGRARRVEILASSGTTRTDQRRLAQSILRSRFRPRTADGRFVDSGRLVVRYGLQAHTP